MRNIPIARNVAFAESMCLTNALVLLCFHSVRQVHSQRAAVIRFSGKAISFCGKSPVKRWRRNAAAKYADMIKVLLICCALSVTKITNFSKIQSTVLFNKIVTVG